MRPGSCAGAEAVLAPSAEAGGEGGCAGGETGARSGAAAAPAASPQQRARSALARRSTRRLLVDGGAGELRAPRPLGTLQVWPCPHAAGVPASSQTATACTGQSRKSALACHVTRIRLRERVHERPQSQRSDSERVTLVPACVPIHAPCLAVHMHVHEGATLHCTQICAACRPATRLVYVDSEAIQLYR